MVIERRKKRFLPRALYMEFEQFTKKLWLWLGL